MASENLKGVKVAILVEDGFEQVEMTEPRKPSTRPAPRHASFRLRANGSAPGTSPTGETISRSTSAGQAQSQDFDACICPAA